MTHQSGIVVGLFLQTEHGSRGQSVEQATAVVGQGIEGDLHSQGRPGRPRQVLLAAEEDLVLFGLRPGDLREQITVRMPGLMQLPPGSRLKIGSAEAAITKECEPCTHVGTLLSIKDPEDFRHALTGHRGMLAKIVSADGHGQIKVGDAVEIVGPNFESTSV